MTIAHSSDYRADIDGLRALAVMAVVFFHAFPGRLPAGFIGVDIFFVISGYLITGIIIRGLDFNNFDFLDFYIRRAKRILPALLLVMLSSLCFAWFALLPEELSLLGQHLMAGATFTSNILLWTEAGYFDAAAELKPLLHLWSLAIEEQFYLIWPLLLWIGFRFKLKALQIAGLLAVLSFLFGLYVVRINPTEAFYSPLTRFWELMVGGITAILQQPGRRLNKLTASFANFCSVLGLLMLLFGFFLIDKERKFPGGWALLPVLGTAFLILAGPNSIFNQKVLSLPILVRIGLISFPLYLWHWPLLTFPLITEASPPSVQMRLALISLSIALAWVTYVFIEKPIRFSNSKRAVPVVLTAILVLVGILGAALWLREGFSDRRLITAVSAARADLTFTLRKNHDKPCQGIRGYCVHNGLPITSAVIGDSHARRFYWGLNAEFAEPSQIGLILHGAGGCPPLLNVQSVDWGGKDRECETMVSNNLKKLISNNDIIDIYLSARWSLYSASNKSDGQFESNLRGWMLSYRSNDGRQLTGELAFEQAFRDTLIALVSAGKRVHVVHNVPELPFKITECIDARPLRLLGGGIRTPCEHDQDSFMKNHREERQRMANILDHFQNINVIDPVSVLCNGRVCQAAEDGTLLYTDGSHLSHKGAEFLVRNLKLMID